MQRTALFAALCLIGLAGPALAECKLQGVADLPVTMRGPIPLVTAKVNGVDVLFRADSGAFFSLLSSTTAAKLGLKPHELPFGMTVYGVGGKANDVKAVTAKTFKLGSVEVGNLDFLVGGDQLFAGQDTGLLGQNILRASDVEYDLANGMIHLWQPKGCDNLPLAYWSKSPSSLAVEPTSARDPHLQGMVTINGAKIRATFDTGATSSILSLRAAERAGITPQTAGVKGAGEGRGLGRHVAQTWVTPPAKVEIGDEAIANTRMLFGDVSLDDSGILIGADFFLSHRVYVAYSQRRLYFTYNGGSIFAMESGPRPRRPRPAPRPLRPVPSTPPVSAGGAPPSSPAAIMPTPSRILPARRSWSRSTLSISTTAPSRV